MKYRVSYQCRTDGKTFKSEFEVESQSVPTRTDCYVIELAQKDSIKFYKSGLAGIEIISVDPLA